MLFDTSKKDQKKGKPSLKKYPLHGSYKPAPYGHGKYVPLMYDRFGPAPPLPPG